MASSLIPALILALSHPDEEGTPPVQPISNVDLEEYRDKRRLILFIASKPSDDEVQKFARQVRRHDEALRERQVSILWLFGAGQGFFDNCTIKSESVDELRDSYRERGSDYQAVLIGKDGEVKARQKDEAISLKGLLDRIDAMPRRQREMHEQEESSEEEPMGPSQAFDA